MKPFFTMNTIEGSVWCKPCNKKTQWKITGGQPQYCLVCFAKLEDQHAQPKPAARVEAQTFIVHERTKMKNPETPAEWQEAVDAAHVMLAIQSAEIYGFITTGLKIDQERCMAILKAGAAIGCYPAPDAIAKAFK